MNLNAKLTILEQMIDIYDQFVGEFDLACEKYCAHCCTANVTLTTLEGYRIIDHLEKAGEIDTAWRPLPGGTPGSIRAPGVH
jgi:hypothetical protein